MSFSLERYKQVARACKVLEILQGSRYGKTSTELRDAVVADMGLTAISEKSIQRDIKFWQGYGFDIVSRKTGDPERRVVWELKQGPLKIDRIEVSVMELLAFAAARELLAPLAGTPYWEGIQMLWGKLRRALPEAVWSDFEKLRTTLIVRGPAGRNQAEKEGMLSALNRAIYQHRVTEIRYRSLAGGKPHDRRVEPHAVLLHQGSIYLVAADAGISDGPFKLFKLDRLARVAPSDDRFVPRNDFDPERLFADSVGIFRSGRKQSFRIQIGGPAAQWVTESPLHPRQSAEPQADGSVVLSIPAAYEEEILAQVLALGEHAEILSPAESRQALHRIGQQIARRHAAGIPAEG